VIADDNAFDLAGAMDQDTDLAIYLRRDCTKRAGQITAYDLVGSDPFPCQPLETPDLLSLQPPDISGYR